MRLLLSGLCARASGNARLLPSTPRQAFLRPVCHAIRAASTEAAHYREQSSQPSPSYPEQPAPTRQDVRRGKTLKKAQTKNHDIAEAGGRKEDHSPSAKSLKGNITILNKTYEFDETSNLSASVTNLIDRRLYDTPNHPLCITRKLIESVFPGPVYANHVAYNPVVTTEQNFDALGFPKDHPGRSRTDTYYVDSEHVLRTHTSAHQHNAFQFMKDHVEEGYTIVADVFRRDSIDRSHFPVFHQMEGARLWKIQEPRQGKAFKYQMHDSRLSEMNIDCQEIPENDLELVEIEGQDPERSAYNIETNPPQAVHSLQEVRVMVSHLKRSLELLVDTVFKAAQKAGLGDEAIGKGERLKVRWVNAYFPFTSPSFELEVFWQGEWLELLGCGITQQKILNNAGLEDRIGWAWGIGVERLAMLLFGVPDIRLFWSEDPRFLNQFTTGKITKYEPFSKYPACYKDVAFWIDAAPTGASLISAEPGTGTAAAAGGDATKASPSETQPAAFHENDVMEIVRDIAGSLAEDVKLVDEFVHPTNGRKSLCYRINYRSLERTLKNEEVNLMHQRVVERLGAELKIEMR